MTLRNLTAVPSTPAAPPEPYVLRFADLSVPPTPLKWVVRNIVPAGGRTLIAGEPGAGKTYLLLVLAVDTASGTPFLGQDRFRVANNPGPVLLALEEGSENSLVARLAAVVKGRGFNLADPEWRERIYLSPPQGVGLGSWERWDALRTKVRELRPSLIALDPAAVMMAGDFKEGGDVNLFLAAVGELQREAACEAQPDGAAVLLAAHTTWNAKDRVGGAIQWRGGVDLELNYRRAKRDPSDLCDPCARLSWEKVRDGEPPRPMLLGLDLDRDPEGTPLRAALRYIGEPEGVSVEGPALRAELDAFLAGATVRPMKQIMGEFLPGGKKRDDESRYKLLTRTLNAGKDEGRYLKTPEGWALTNGGEHEA